MKRLLYRLLLFLSERWGLGAKAPSAEPEVRSTGVGRVEFFVMCCTACEATVIVPGAERFRYRCPECATLVTTPVFADSAAQASLAAPGDPDADYCRLCGLAGGRLPPKCPACAANEETLLAAAQFVREQARARDGRGS